MQLIINGEPRDVTATNLEEALNAFGAGGDVVATALNGVFVPAQARGAARLKAGDKIEVLAPMQGG